MIRLVLILTIPVLVAGIFVSCEKQPAPAASVGGPDAKYTIRALIDSLPTADGKQFLSLHHEAIPTFADKDGKIVGMKEMSMPFPKLAAGVSLDGLKVGDGVEATFEVRWKQSPRTLVTMIRKLPEGTAPDLKHK